MAWPRKYRTFWCVVDKHGTAYLGSARGNRSKSIAAFLNDNEQSSIVQDRSWATWRRWGFFCQRCDVKVRATLTETNGHQP